MNLTQYPRNIFNRQRLCDRWHVHCNIIHYAPPTVKQRKVCAETFSIFSDLQKYLRFFMLMDPGGGYNFPTSSLVNHCSLVLAWCSVGLKPCSGNSFSHPQLNLLISTTQEQLWRRLDAAAAAPTYQRAVFRNPPPQVIYLNTDTSR